MKRRACGTKRAKTYAANQPAKITLPSARNSLPRERLYRALDCEKPIVWIGAPAGSGKTTLVASYLHARIVPCIWYQIDEGDADIASFFYYMGQAVKHAAPRYRKPLPLLTPEYLQGVPVFTRRYFEELFHRLKPPTVIVFDNYQDAPPGSGFHEMMSHALETIPEGIKVIVLSRGEPPPELSRLRANNAMQHVGWEDIRFTLNESRELLKAQGWNQPSDQDLRIVHAKIEGWAAGYILLSERAITEQLGVRDLEHLSSSAIFDYFANQIFDKRDLRSQHFLLLTAFLPSVTVRIAEQLTGIEEAEEILERFTQHHYFTQKHVQAEPSYQYHPLFRDFLRSRAMKRLSTLEVAAIQRQAAALLEGAGQVEAAASLYIEARDWEEVTRLIQQHGATFVAQGRSKTLQAWLAHFPPALIDESPWLIYWSGRSRMFFDPYEGRAHLIRAYDLFKERKEPAGQLLAWADIVDTIFYAWGESRERWIREFDEAVASGLAFPSPELEARTTVAMLSLVAGVRIHRADVGEWAKKVADLAQRYPVQLAKMRMYQQLVTYHLWIGDFAEIRSILLSLGSPAGAPEDDPMSHLNWYDMNAQYAWVSADHETCFSFVRKGLDLAERTGVHFLDAYLFKFGISAAVSLGYPEVAEQLLTRMASRPLTNPMVKSFYHYLAALAEWRGGEVKKAIEDAAIALDIVGGLDYRVGPFCAYVMAALACHDDGRFDEAAHHVRHACELAGGGNYLEYISLLISAGIALDKGKTEDDVLVMIRRALGIGARQGYLNFAWWHPPTMSRLCAIALEHGIEPAYVRRLITARQLPPPLEVAADFDVWPWPVKIHTLGDFAIYRDGELVRFAGKVQRRPLMLLRTLIALGGQKVSETQLAEALWPDADGDSARMNLRPAVHRLRKLIGSDVLHTEDGALSIDPSRCWVDVWALERRLEALNRASGSRDAHADYEALRKLLADYVGPFLPGDNTPETVALRERLRLKLVRHVLDIGEALTRAGTWSEALSLYEQAIAIDPYAESLHRGLMQCHLAFHQPAEVLRAYERCATFLKSQFGLDPSSETRSIARQARLEPLSA